MFRDWTNFLGLAIIAYAEHIEAHDYGSLRSHDDILAALHPFNELNTQPIVDEALVHIRDRLAVERAHAIVFVSLFNNEIYDQNAGYIRDILAKNVTLTFVAMGLQADMKKLKWAREDVNVIPWQKIKNENEPKDWQRQFWSAYGCGLCLLILVFT